MLASIIAIAAVGEAMVVITRNVDLSVEAVIGLVAFVVADLLANQSAADAPAAMAFGIGLGLVLGHDQRRRRGGASASRRSSRRSARCQHLPRASTSCSPAASRSP